VIRGRVEAKDSGVVYEKGRAHINGGLSIRVARRASNSLAPRGVTKAPDSRIEKEVSKPQAKSKRVYTKPDLALNESDPFEFELLERSAGKGTSVKSQTKSGKQMPVWQIGPCSPRKPSSKVHHSKSPLIGSQGSIISHVIPKRKVCKKCRNRDGHCVVPKKALLELSAYLTAFFDMFNLRKDIEQMSKAPHVSLAIYLIESVEILLE
jgi:hypothetical protein